VKVQRKYYNISPIEPGMIINCKHFEHKPTVKMQDGIFVDVPGSFTWWLDSYYIVRNYSEINNG